jgi:hypothetical protein
LKKPKIAVAFIFLGMVVAISCVLFRAPVLTLEHRNMIFLRVAELQPSRPQIVRISGACADAFVIRKSRTKQEGAVIIVNMYASLASPVILPWDKGSQIFQVDIVVPESATEIHLGREDFVIWKK